MSPADSTEVELDDLIRLFFVQGETLGAFESVAAAEIAEPSRSLLAHSAHMTVTVEKYHGCPVDVKVLNTRTDADHYSREILLTRTTDDAVVQYGIVRLDMSVLAADVRAEIESQETPLGRILISHNVLRSVKLENLYSVACGQRLADLFDRPVGEMVAGRTAMIYCDDLAAIELLEIVQVPNG